MKNCELCKVPARTFCESDQASLCWECDAKVHGANFLVARHSRTLLCHACQSPTPWKASGAKLGNTVSLCEICAGGMKVDAEEGEESEGGNDDEIDTEADDLDDDEDDEVGGDEDGDNQVVPWSSTPTPPAASSSSSEESVSRCNNDDEGVSESVTTTSLKRRREDHNFQDGPNRSPSRRRYGAGWREEVACDGGPPSEESPMSSSDGETRPVSAMDTFEGPHGCCDDRASEGV